MPEPSRDRNQCEGVPEIGAAFGDHFRIIGDACLQEWDQGRVRIDPHFAAQTRVEIDLVEKPLETADMIHVRVRDVDRPRRRAVAIEIGAQRFLAAIDHQERLAVALEHAARRAELGRGLRAADTEEAQRPVHRPAPPATCAAGRTVSPA